MTDICIVDFCGSTVLKGIRVYPFSCSADWNGRHVRFSGAWCEVPDLPADLEPTEAEVEAWAAKYFDPDTFLQAYFNEN